MKKHRTQTPAPPAELPKPDHVDELLDEAESESFPASDPVAVTPRRKPVEFKPDARRQDAKSDGKRQKRSK